MKSAPSLDVAEIAERLRNLLAVVPIASGVNTRDGDVGFRGEVDAAFDLNVSGKAWTLLAEINSSGQPRHVRDAALRLRRALETDHARTYGIIVAPFLSAQSQEILRSEGLGWMDLAGNSRISFGGMHIEIEKTQRDPFTTKRAQQSLFAPKSARVLRAMMTNPGPWKVTELSARAGVSLGQVSNVRRLLLDKEWAEVDPAGGLRLRQPGAVLDAWRDAVRPPEVAMRAYTTLHGSELDSQMRELFGRAQLAGAQVLLAGHSVARRLAPFARISGEFFYADANGIELIKHHLRTSPADRGENITVFQVPDDGLWAEALNRPQGMHSAGLVQTYLDLWSTGERGREAAEHFRRELLDPSLVTAT